jgi:hypothetical protein
MRKLSAGILSTLISITAFAKPKTLNEVVSIQQNADGQFSVVCTNGAAETITLEQLSDNDICGDAPTVAYNFLSMQRSQSDQGQFDTVCKDLTRESVSVMDIMTSNFCLYADGSYAGVAKQGSYQTTFAANALLAMPVTVTKTGKVKKWGVITTEQIDPNFKMALYTNVNNAPGTLVAKSDAFFVTTGRFETEGKNEDVAAGNYWLMWQSDANVNIGATGGDSLLYSVSQTFGDFPATAPSGSVSNNGYGPWNVYVRIQ